VLLRALAELPDKRSAAKQSTAILAEPEGESNKVVLTALTVRAVISWDEAAWPKGLSCPARLSRG